MGPRRPTPPSWENQMTGRHISSAHTNNDRPDRPLRPMANGGRNLPNFRLVRCRPCHLIHVLIRCVAFGTGPSGTFNNTLPDFCDNDDDVDNGCAGGNFNGRDDVAKEIDGVGGVVWSSLPSWCSSRMETHWRMALDGITTLSTWPTMIWSIIPSVTFSSLSLSYGGETHQPASLPS